MYYMIKFKTRNYENIIWENASGHGNGEEFVEFGS